MPTVGSGTGPARVLVGRVGPPHGIRGWIRIHSYTRPPENILEYLPWIVSGRAGEQDWQPLEARVNAKGVLVRLDGIGDRNAAERYRGCRIEVRRERLPEPPAGQYYWTDLVGLRVEDVRGNALGTVTGLRETGANDVLVVDGARRILIPFVPDEVVKSVDLAVRRVCVSWDPDD